MAYIQGNSHANGGTSSTTVAVTLAATVGVGNALCVAVGFSGSAGDSLASVTDDKGNTYTVVDSVEDPAVTGFVFGSAYCANITNAPQTITATLAIGAKSFATIFVDEFSLIASVSPLDGHSINTQNPAGTWGPLTATSGSFTTTVAGDLIWGAIVNDQSVGTVAVGSGFTSAQTPLANVYLSEYQIQGAAGAIAATFAAGGGTGGTGLITVGLALKPQVGVIQNVAGDLSPSVSFDASSALTDFLAVAGDLSPSTAFAAETAVNFVLAGDLSPSIAFAATLTVFDAIAGDLSPSVAFAADTANLLVLTGDLSPSVAFAGTATDFLAVAGDLSPSVAFAADTANLLVLIGDLSLSTAFAAETAVNFVLAGDLSPSVVFVADVTVTSASDLAPGDLSSSVVFGGAILVSFTLNSDLSIAPFFLGGETEFDVFNGNLVPSVAFVADLTAGEPAVDLVGDLFCAPDFSAEIIYAGWHPISSCGAPTTGSAYGIGAYGVNSYSKGITSVWKKKEPCPRPGRALLVDA